MEAHHPHFPRRGQDIIAPRARNTTGTAVGSRPGGIGVSRSIRTRRAAVSVDSLDELALVVVEWQARGHGLLHALQCLMRSSGGAGTTFGRFTEWKIPISSIERMTM